MAVTTSPQQNNSGIGFAGLLTILFIGLKLTKYVTWSWLWVFAPLWLPLLVVIGITGIVALIVAIFSK